MKSGACFGSKLLLLTLVFDVGWRVGGLEGWREPRVGGSPGLKNTTLNTFPATCDFCHVTSNTSFGSCKCWVRCWVRRRRVRVGARCGEDAPTFPTKVTLTPPCARRAAPPPMDHTEAPRAPSSPLEILGDPCPLKLHSVYIITTKNTLQYSAASWCKIVCEECSHFGLCCKTSKSCEKLPSPWGLPACA